MSYTLTKLFLMNKPAIISLKVRGLFSIRITRLISNQDQLDCWHMAGYPVLVKSPKTSGYDHVEARKIFQTYSNHTDWTNSAQAQVGIDALGNMCELAMQDALSSHVNDLYGEFTYVNRSLSQLGYRINLNTGVIDKIDTINTELFDPEFMKNADWFELALDGINRDYDNADYASVISRSKKLIESTAMAIIREVDATWKPTGQGLFDSTMGKCMTIVGIEPDRDYQNGMQHQTYLMVDYARKMAIAVNKMRNDSGGDHDAFQSARAEKAHARLAIDSAILWCRYMVAMKPEEKPWELGDSAPF